MKTMIPSLAALLLATAPVSAQSLLGVQSVAQAMVAQVEGGDADSMMQKLSNTVAHARALVGDGSTPLTGDAAQTWKTSQEEARALVQAIAAQLRRQAEIGADPETGRIVEREHEKLRAAYQSIGAAGSAALEALIDEVRPIAVNAFTRSPSSIRTGSGSSRVPLLSVVPPPCATSLPPDHGIGLLPATLVAAINAHLARGHSHRTGSLDELPPPRFTARTAARIRLDPEGPLEAEFRLLRVTAARALSLASEIGDQSICMEDPPFQKFDISRKEFQHQLQTYRAKLVRRLQAQIAEAEARFQQATAALRADADHAPRFTELVRITQEGAALRTRLPTTGAIDAFLEPISPLSMPRLRGTSDSLAPLIGTTLAARLAIPSETRSR